MSGDEDLSACELVDDLEIEDVHPGDIVVFGVKEAGSEELVFALGKVKLKRVKEKSFSIHYLEPLVPGEPGGRYKEAYESSDKVKKAVQWRCRKELKNLLCRISLPSSGKLGDDIVKELINRVKLEYAEVIND